MNLLSWISTAIAHAVTQGVRQGLEDAGIDPDSTDNPLAAAKTHVVASGKDENAEVNGKARRTKAVS